MVWYVGTDISENVVPYIRNYTASQFSQMSLPATTTHGLTSDDHSETVRCLSVTKFSCQFSSCLSRARSLAVLNSGQVRSGLASARNKPVGRYLFRSVFPFTLILLCPLGATQFRPAMSVQHVCRFSFVGPREYGGTL